MRGTTFGANCALALALSATSGFGEVPGSVSTPPGTYGTTSDTVLSLGAFAFQGFNSNVTTQASLDSRWVTLGASLVAPVSLPDGASISQLELDACDLSADAEVMMTFRRCAGATSNCITPPSLVTGGAATPGCGTFVLPLDPHVQVSNAAEHYLVYVSTGGSIDTRFSAVRVRYRLQVSPAPATATFADVPAGSALHQYVEALVAAGVTAGCGDGNYCPGASVTRGQMAVFLAKALGLHWTP